MVNETSLTPQPAMAQNEPIRGEFATKIIASQCFADIRALYPNVTNWEDIDQEVSQYAGVIESGLISNNATRMKVRQAKGYLMEIIQLQILHADNFLDVPCVDLLKTTVLGCKTCGCIDEDDENCCCPKEVNFIPATLSVVWRNSMVLTVYDANNNDLEVEKQVRGELCWYDIPTTAVKLKIRLKWWDFFNTHEVRLQML